MQISTLSDLTLWQDRPILLREDKLEFGLGGPDAYMQLARCYDLVVGVLTSSIEIDSNANNYLTYGAPCFLICLMGSSRLALTAARERGYK